MDLACGESRQTFTEVCSMPGQACRARGDTGTFEGVHPLSKWQLGGMRVEREALLRKLRHQPLLSGGRGGRKCRKEAFLRRPK